MNVGEIIKDKRQELRILQKELAEKVGCSPGLICKWEKNQISPSIKQLKIIESILNTGILTKEFMQKTGGND